MVLDVTHGVVLPDPVVLLNAVVLSNAVVLANAAGISARVPAGVPAGVPAADLEEDSGTAIDHFQIATAAMLVSPCDVLVHVQIQYQVANAAAAASAAAGEVLAGWSIRIVPVAQCRVLGYAASYDWPCGSKSMGSGERSDRLLFQVRGRGTCLRYAGVRVGLLLSEKGKVEYRML